METILIIGMGQGLSKGIAEKFGKEGYQVGMISRNTDKLETLQKHLETLGIKTTFAVADAADTAALLAAIETIRSTLGSITVLQYNAVDYRMKFLLDETVEELVNGFKVSVANALVASNVLLPDLKANKGSILLTGGSSGNDPSPEMASISLGKAGIRNLALQLHQALKEKGVFVGTVTVSGAISPDSLSHSPEILAEIFWQMNRDRDKVEIVH